MNEDATLTKHDLVLASTSPRRADILKRLGVSFLIVFVEIDESHSRGETPCNYVRRLALRKAEIAASMEYQPRTPVLAADTTVVIDGFILGKPSGLEQAREMLSRLSGRWHDVYSGLAMMQESSKTISVRTRVKFRSIKAAEIGRYWDTGEPRDKAGAYGIQGLGGAFVEKIDGSYSNVVGLPMAETIVLLEKYKVGHLLRPKITAPRS
ncbi:MAG TPA: septum formation protein Maf [Gammaproteobacteria bacterium]|nr:septum formation protein Maf [Gammaproteobacteria bacterium]